MLKIRRDDNVKVIAGRDRGKTGKVLKVFPDDARAIVQGVNFVKRHQRRRSQEDQGGIVQKESMIQLSNLMIVCKGCNRPTRVGFSTLADGTKARLCKKCQEIL